MGSSSPSRSGIVTSVRYQLKHTRPVERRRIVSAGASRSHCRVVEVGGLGVREHVERAVGHGARPERVGRARAGELDEVDLLDPRVRVPPLAAHEGHARVGLQVDDRVRPPGQELGRAGDGGRGLDLGGRHHASTSASARAPIIASSLSSGASVAPDTPIAPIT